MSDSRLVLSPIFPWIFEIVCERILAADVQLKSAVSLEGEVGVTNPVHKSSSFGQLGLTSGTDQAATRSRR
jgi:hypothetical protein